MKTIMFVAAILSATACSKKSSDCEAVFDHTVSLLPEAMRGQVTQDKAKALEKCEKASPEARSCALAATSMEDLMKCPSK